MSENEWFVFLIAREKKSDTRNFPSHPCFPNRSQSNEGVHSMLRGAQRLLCKALKQPPHGTARHPDSKGLSEAAAATTSAKDFITNLSGVEPVVHHCGHRHLHHHPRPSSGSAITPLLEYNKAWSEHIRQIDPAFFPTLEQQQSPQYMYIGCSDSRVAANQIVGLAPGELFVHRNIANIVARSDLNCLSALQYAVDELRVEHVIVCGHYGCGGVKAALNDTRVGLADNWIMHVVDVKDRYADQLHRVPQHLQLNALCELNVITQIGNVAETHIMRDVWSSKDKANRLIDIHGWVYGLHDGLLHPLVHLTRSCNVRKKLAAAVEATIEKYASQHRK